MFALNLFGECHSQNSSSIMSDGGLYPLFVNVQVNIANWLKLINSSQDPLSKKAFSMLVNL